MKYLLDILIVALLCAMVSSLLTSSSWKIKLKFCFQFTQTVSALPSSLRKSLEDEWRGEYMIWSHDIKTNTLPMVNISKNGRKRAQHLKAK